LPRKKKKGKGKKGYFPFALVPTASQKGKKKKEGGVRIQAKGNCRSFGKRGGGEKKKTTQRPPFRYRKKKKGGGESCLHRWDWHPFRERGKKKKENFDRKPQAGPGTNSEERAHLRKGKSQRGFILSFFSFLKEGGRKHASAWGEKVKWGRTKPFQKEGGG